MGIYADLSALSAYVNMMKFTPEPDSVVRGVMIMI